MVIKILLYVVCLTGAGIGIIFASAADVAGLRLHGWILLVGSIAALFSYIGKKAQRQAFDEDKILSQLGIKASLMWGSIAAILQILILLPLLKPVGLSWEFLQETFSYGRIYPSFITAMLYGFGGNILMTCGFYILRRTCQTDLAPRGLGYFVFWGYQLFLILAVSGSVLGISQGKLYAEAEWYADILLLLVWLSFLVIYVGTLLKRKGQRIYVSNWFYLAFIIGFLFLHILNGLSVPASLFGAKSYSLFSGVQEAVVQSLYYYNMSNFFLVMGFLGVMYYFLPKVSGNPVYSYHLSFWHFWSLAVLSLWAFPQSLYFTTLPGWVQDFGMIVLIMLTIPSWGGAINGILTLHKKWHLFWQNPVISMMVFGILFYMVAVLVSLLGGMKILSDLWGDAFGGISGTYFGHLGWAGLFAFAVMYYLVPVLWDRKSLYSVGLVYWHLVLLLLSMVLYGLTSALDGMVQSYMLGSYDIFGFLRYRQDQVIISALPFYLAYLVSGILYLFLTEHFKPAVQITFQIVTQRGKNNNGGTL